MISNRRFARAVCIRAVPDLYVKVCDLSINGGTSKIVVVGSNSRSLLTRSCSKSILSCLESDSVVSAGLEPILLFCLGTDSEMGLVGPKQKFQIGGELRRLLKRLENCYTQFSTVFSTQVTVRDSTSPAGPAEPSFQSVSAKLSSITVNCAPKLNYEHLIKTINVKIDEFSAFLQTQVPVPSTGQLRPITEFSKRQHSPTSLWKLATETVNMKNAEKLDQAQAL